MSLSSIFKIREEVTHQILELLTKTTLGTNGAMYRHLDTEKRILEADNPLFLTMERNNKVLGNITFCRRGEFWYIRYFAFDSMVQARESKTKESKGNSIIKRELGNFFSEVFQGSISDLPVQSMYAYIDPKNDRSKWMSESFGFNVIGHLATQSFSRISPKKSKLIRQIENWKEIEDIVLEKFRSQSYYYDTHIQKPPFYILKNDKDEIIAFAHISRVHWEIVRLPGKSGAFLTKAIPYIPFLNKLIKPKNHHFLVPDSVFVKGNDPKLLEELFSGILFEEKMNLLLWWIDMKDPLYLKVKNTVNWGLLDKIVGVNPVDVVEKRHPENQQISKAPIFVSAWDLI